MAGETMRFRNPAGHAGLVHSLISLVNSLAGFLESRLALLATESKTALVHVLVLVGCLLGAALLAIFGYIFLVASAVIGLAHAFGVSWVKISLIAAGVHFVLALVCVLIARSRMKKPMFEMTSTELKKDRAWLKNQDKKSHSTN